MRPPNLNILPCEINLNDLECPLLPNSCVYWTTNQDENTCLSRLVCLSSTVGQFRWVNNGKEFFGNILSCHSVSLTKSRLFWATWLTRQAFVYDKFVRSARSHNIFWFIFPILLATAIACARSIGTIQILTNSAIAWIILSPIRTARTYWCQQSTSHLGNRFDEWDQMFFFCLLNIEIKIIQSTPRWILCAVNS